MIILEIIGILGLVGIYACFVFVMGDQPITPDCRCKADERVKEDYCLRKDCPLVTDEVDDLHGWNPQGVYCGLCSNTTCEGCVNEHTLVEGIAVQQACSEYTPNGDTYPLCKGNASDICPNCFLYEDMTGEGMDAPVDISSGDKNKVIGDLVYYQWELQQGGIQPQYARDRITEILKPFSSEDREVIKAKVEARMNQIGGK